jgi:hypothetical protein
MQPIQPSTFAIRTCRHATKNYERACLSATAFLPTQLGVGHFSEGCLTKFPNIVVLEAGLWLV